MKAKLVFLVGYLAFLSYNAVALEQECLFNGVWVPLQHIQNVTVEGFRDARLVGKCKLYAPGYCINGEYINVWVAPNEYPGKLIVHNGMQGPQCTYKTWLIK